MEEEVVKPPEPSLSIQDVTSLVHLFNNMLSGVEGRLVAKLDENERRAQLQWSAHGKETDVVVTSFNTHYADLAQRVDSIEKRVNIHLDKERDETLVLNARVAPIKSVVLLVVKNWKTILLVILALLALFDISADTIRKILFVQ